MLIVFDLDGTLALNDHREHFISGPEKNWSGFYDACDRDEPCEPLLEVLRTMSLHHRVEIWSGRGYEVMEKTRAWLVAHGAGHVKIQCRAEGDYRADTILKTEWLENSDQRPDLVFEDRASVVEMYRSHGIVCAQVAPGNF